MNRMLKKIVLAVCLCTGLAALIAARGGCVPDPCPNLYIACPSLECPDGFQVDKNGCAICECVGEPAPVACLTDSECAEGQRCDIENFCDSPPGCEQQGMSCPAVCYGRCVDVDPADSCDLRERDLCETDGRCELVELPMGVPCDCDCPPEALDCVCDECVDTGWACIPVEPPPPPPAECFTDQDCPRDFYCESFVNCGEGDLDCGMGGGVCLPVEPPPPAGCLSDSECAEGQRCDLDNFCDAMPGCEPGMDCPPVCYGRCVDVDPADSCELRERDLCETDGRCELVELPMGVPCACDCPPEALDCVCDDCVDTGWACVPVEPPPPPPAECFNDADCPQGTVCLRPTVDCLPGELDCGMIPGTCEPPPSDVCANLDEGICIDSPACLPRYEEMQPCAACGPDEPCPPCQNEWVFTGCAPADPGLTCASVDCAPGFTCVMEQVQCFTEPCPPMPVCVPVDPPVVCGDGSPLACRMMIPDCEPGLVVGVFNGCYECVAPDRCEPFTDPPLCQDGSTCTNGS